jgi:uncharacterized protein (TIGR02270 family)
MEPAGTVLWDVVEEHLDDASYQWTQWSRAFGSALTAPEVGEGIEERLLASVDALTIAAPEAGAQLLEPAVREGEPGATAAATLALLDLPSGFLSVRRALACEDGARRAALQRALALSSRTGLEREVEPLLEPEHPGGAVAALAVYAARRLDAGPRLVALIDSSDAEVSAAALRAACWTSQPVRAAVERTYRSDEELARAAALEAGLALGFRSALDASRKLVASRAPSPAALVAVAMSGAPSDLELLHAALEEAPLRRAALHGIGLAGSARSIDVILPWLAEPATARVAGEAFAAITGIAIAGDLAATEDDAEELPSELLPGRDHDLPRPDPDAVMVRWERERQRFDSGVRYLGGVPFSGEALRAALGSAPMRRRPALALELAVRSRRALVVDCRAFARDQLRAERQDAHRCARTRQRLSSASSGADALWALANRTPYAAERTWIRDRDGGHRWVVAVKATFALTDAGKVTLADEQRPVLVAPEHHGDPATTSLRYDAELGPDKPTTDLIVNGVAHPPGGKPVKRLEVGLRAGPVAKDLVVYGMRIFQRGLVGVTPCGPVPFESRPLIYEWAYGGTDHRDPDPKHHGLDLRNPVGKGFAVHARDLLGQPAHSIEYPSSDPRKAGPAGFGAIANHWSPRLELAGTFDGAWARERRPLLPLDWDALSALSSPADQRPPAHFRGGETVALGHLTPKGVLRFELPRIWLTFAGGG